MDMAARLKALERENRELQQASDILRKASAYAFLQSQHLTQAERKKEAAAHPRGPVLPGQANHYHLASPPSNSTLPAL